MVVLFQLQLTLEKMLGCWFCCHLGWISSGWYRYFGAVYNFWKFSCLQHRWQWYLSPPVIFSAFIKSAIHSSKLSCLRPPNAVMFGTFKTKCVSDTSLCILQWSHSTTWASSSLHWLIFSNISLFLHAKYLKESPRVCWHNAVLDFWIFQYVHWYFLRHHQDQKPCHWEIPK